MSNDLNTVILTGRLTADPELRYTQSGKAVAGFNLATGRKYKDQRGELQEDTSFIGCTAFGQQAEFIGQYIRKGQAILVQGRLKQDTWEDSATGKKQSKTKVVVEFVKSIDRRGNDEQIQRQAAPQREALKPHETTPDIERMDDDVPF